MGMYDYLGKTQVKCFYLPVISHEIDSIPGLEQKPITKLEYWATMGSLHMYRVGQKVPYKTLWYDYGKNFKVFDTMDVEGTGLIHIIRGGRYLCSIPHQKFNSKLFSDGPVISKTGEELLVKTKEDFAQILEDAKRITEAQRAATKEFWETHPEDSSVLESIRYSNDATESLYKDYHQKWIDPTQDIQKGWAVGGFLSGLSGFAEDDDTVKRYVKLFHEAAETTEKVSKMIDEYSEWCHRHNIGIYHSELLNFFMNFPTLENLEKLMSVKL